MLAAAEARFRAAIAAAVAIDPNLFDRAGTTVVSSEDRRDSRLVSAYHIGLHVIVWCDPGVTGQVDDLASASARLDIGTMERWAADHGAEYLGGAWSHLVDPEALPVTGIPEDASRVRLDPGDTSDRALIAELIEGSDPEDADAAELELDDLDPHIVGLIDDAGRLAVCAGERPWDVDGTFGDIGVLARADRRKLGWGRAAVVALSEEVFARGRVPLYRCNWDAPASRNLALGLRFREVLSLAAVVLK